MFRLADEELLLFILLLLLLLERLTRREGDARERWSPGQTWSVREEQRSREAVGDLPPPQLKMLDASCDSPIQSLCNK